MLCKAKLPSQLEDLSTEQRQHAGPEQQPVIQPFGSFYQASERHFQAVCVGQSTVISKHISYDWRKATSLFFLEAISL